MTTQEYMSVLYPVLTGLSGGYALLKFVFWWTTRRTHVTFFDSCFMLTETIVLLLLTLTTGVHPVLNIEQYRFLVSGARSGMAIVLLACIVVTWHMIRRHGLNKR